MGTAAQTIDHEKFERLKAVAQGGKEGLDQYDAAQRSVAQERATMAAGLAGDAKSADYFGPSIGGAPTATAKLLGAGLSPFDSALAASRSSFTQNLQQGLAANLRYMEQAKAAIGPTLAAARSGGGGGGGGGGGSSSLTDTQLRNALLAAAQQAREAQVSAINASQHKAADALGNVPQATLVSSTVGPNPMGVRRFDLPDTVPTSVHRVGGPRGGSVQASNPALADWQKANETRLGTAASAQAAQVDRLRALLTTRVNRQQRVEGSSILPLATDIGTQAGLDPALLAGMLTPQAEVTYRNALTKGNPKPPAAPDAVDPAPIPYDRVGKALKLSDAEVRAVLGVAYRTGVVDSKGNQKTGNLVTDLVDTARILSKQGFDYESYRQYVLSKLPATALKKHPRALEFGLGVGSGYFVEAPKAAPAAPVNPYAAYYEQRYPSASVR